MNAMQTRLHLPTIAFAQPLSSLIALALMAAFGLMLFAAPSAGAQVRVMAVDGSAKLRPSDSVVSSITTAPRTDSKARQRTPPTPVVTSPAVTIALEGARNEYEMGQVVLASDTSASSVFVSASTLAGPGGQIPAEDVELLLVHYVPVPAASGDRGQAGDWPDALVPLRRPFTLQPNRLQSVMLKVFLRPELAAGTYTGKLTVTAGGTQQLEVVVTLVVWNITLPSRVSLPIVMGVDYESIQSHEGALADPAFEEQVVPAYYAALRRNRSFPLFLYNGIPEVHEEGGRLVVSTDAYKRRLEAAFPNGEWGPVGIPFVESWPVDTARYPLFSTEYRQFASSYLQQMAVFYDGLGLLGRTFVYVPGADEPTEKRHYEAIRNFTDIVHAADPRLRMLQTVYSECQDCASTEGIESLERGAPLWVPNIAYFDNRAARMRAAPDGSGSVTLAEAPSGWTPAFTELVRNRGGEVWWYLNSWTSLLPSPQPNFPNLYIDRPGIDHRVLGWLAYKDRVTALAHWNATFWRNTASPWTDLAKGEGDPRLPAIAGDGSLLYPGAGSDVHTGQPDPSGPVSSLRLEGLREASEDHALLSLAASMGKATLADEVAASVVRSMQDYAQLPFEYQTACRRLAEIIAPTKTTKPPRTR
jgi:hypothetical protein